MEINSITTISSELKFILFFFLSISTILILLGLEWKKKFFDYIYTIDDYQYSHYYINEKGLVRRRQVYEVTIKKQNYFKTSYIKKKAFENAYLDELRKDKTPVVLENRGYIIRLSIPLGKRGSAYVCDLF